MMNPNTMLPQTGNRVNEDGSITHIVNKTLDFLGTNAPAPISNITVNPNSQLPQTGRIVAEDGSIYNVVDMLQALLNQINSGGNGGTTNHAALQNLTFETSNHTGFASQTALESETAAREQQITEAITTEANARQSQVNELNNEIQAADQQATLATNAIWGTENQQGILNGAYGKGLLTNMSQDLTNAIATLTEQNSLLWQHINSLEILGRKLTGEFPEKASLPQNISDYALFTITAHDFALVQQGNSVYVVDSVDGSGNIIWSLSGAFETDISGKADREDLEALETALAAETIARHEELTQAMSNILGSVRPIDGRFDTHRETGLYNAGFGGSTIGQSWVIDPATHALPPDLFDSVPRNGWVNITISVLTTRGEVVRDLFRTTSMNLTLSWRESLFRPSLTKQYTRNITTRTFEAPPPAGQQFVDEVFDWSEVANQAELNALKDALLSESTIRLLTDNDIIITLTEHINQLNNSISVTGGMIRSDETPVQPRGRDAPRATRRGDTAAGFGSLAGPDAPVDESLEGGGNTAYGFLSRAIGANSTAFGNNAAALARATLAMGWNSVASGFNSLVIGSESQATAFSSIAVGNNTFATGSSSVAVGNAITVSSGNSTALGDSSRISANNGTSVGSLSSVTGGPTTQNCSAFGNRAAVFGAGIGATGTQAPGNKNTAIGAESTVRGVGRTGGLAFGSFADVIHDNSAVIAPNGTTTTRPSLSVNQILLGYAGINVAAFSGLTTVSDKNDKTDEKVIDFDVLDFIQKLTPRQYRMDFRDNYAYWQELTQTEYENLDEYTKNHNALIENVMGFKGTSIEWINNHALLPEQSIKNYYEAVAHTGMIMPSYKPKVYDNICISGFLSCYDEAVNVWRASQTKAEKLISGKVIDSDNLPQDTIVRQAYFVRKYGKSDKSQMGKRFHNGFFAQEVQEAAKQVKGLEDFAGVKYLAHNTDKNGIPTGEDRHMMEYDEFHAIWAAGFQELIQENSQLKTRLDSIEKALKQLTTP